MLDAIVTEKGVKAILWSVVSSATERNCFEPSKMADKTCKAQARVWNVKMIHTGQLEVRIQAPFFP